MRSASDLFITGQNEAAFLTGKYTGEEPEQRAGVTAVDWTTGRAQSAQADALDPDRARARLAHRSAERGYGVERRVGIGGVPEAADLADSIGDRGQKRRPLAEALDARYGDVADQRRRRLYPPDAQASSSMMSETTTP